MRTSELIAELQKYPDCDVAIQHDPHFDKRGIGGAFSTPIKSVKGYAGSSSFDSGVVLVPEKDLWEDPRNFEMPPFK